MVYQLFPFCTESLLKQSYGFQHTDSLTTVVIVAVSDVQSTDKISKHKGKTVCVSGVRCSELTLASAYLVNGDVAYMYTFGSPEAFLRIKWCLFAFC